MFSHPRAERNTSLLAQKILVFRHTGDSWCCTSTSDNNKNSAAFFMPRNIAVGQNKCWHRMFLQTVQNLWWICFNNSTTACSESIVGSQRVVAVETAVSNHCSRLCFKICKRITAGYFIYDLPCPTCLFTPGGDHFINLLHAPVVWMVRLSLCSGAVIIWTFICFQKTPGKKRLDHGCRIKENNGFAEEVFLQDPFWSDVSRPVQLPQTFFCQLSHLFSCEEQETDALLLSRWPRLQCYSSTTAFKK